MTGRRIDDTSPATRGLCVAFLGVDGSGKSTILQRLAKAAPDWSNGVVVRHLGPLQLRRHTQAVTNPHGEPPRGFVASLAKCAYWLFEYTIGYWRNVRSDLARGRLVLFDRYLPDVIVDPRRYRYGGPAFLVRLVWRCVPKPDVIILLDAPVEVLIARKQEVEPKEMARLRTAYRQLIARQPGGVIVDASRSEEEVLRQVMEIVEAARGAVPARLHHG